MASDVRVRRGEKKKSAGGRQSGMRVSGMMKSMNGDRERMNAFQVEAIDKHLTLLGTMYNNKTITQEKYNTLVKKYIEKRNLLL